jgi:hypothetical protein
VGERLKAIGFGSEHGCVMCWTEFGEDCALGAFKFECGVDVSAADGRHRIDSEGISDNGPGLRFKFGMQRRGEHGGDPSSVCFYEKQPLATRARDQRLFLL